jgi:hypothetical protein
MQAGVLVANPVPRPRETSPGFKAFGGIGPSFTLHLSSSRLSIATVTEDGSAVVRIRLATTHD